MARSYWLFKTDPESFAVGDFERAPARTTSWDGVRNPEARNLLRGMAIGDRGFLDHSGGESAVVAIVEVVGAAVPDPTAFDRRDDHFDPKSDPKEPTWYQVELRLLERLARPVTLAEVKADKSLASMALVKRGRLSVTPVTAAEWKRVLELSRKAPRAKAAGRGRA